MSKKKKYLKNYNCCNNPIISDDFLIKHINEIVLISLFLTLLFCYIIIIIK
jgi:hypothetical protein